MKEQDEKDREDEKLGEHEHTDEERFAKLDERISMIERHLGMHREKKTPDEMMRERRRN